MQITKFCCRQAFRSSPAVLKFQARTVGLNYRRNEMYQKALLCVLPATDRHATFNLFGDLTPVTGARRTRVMETI